jgi:uncharacterized repeat protein (TIGR01451 family)
MVVNGDTINVDPGTYTEQLVNATAISKSLTLTGAGAGNSIIQCPATLVPDLTLPGQPSTATRPLIEMNNGAQVTMSGFTVTGPGPAANVSISFGILVVGGANLTLHHTTVTHIHSPLDANGQLDTDQTGAGIGVGIQSRNITGQVGTATIHDVIITDYQKTGIRVGFAGSFATITHNTITGFGPSTSIAQNGITLVEGATAAISGNTISLNEFQGGPPATGSGGPDLFNDGSATGIINFGGAGTTITGNNISTNDIGIYNFSGTLSTPTLITGNTLLNNRFHGVVIDAGNATASGNTISGSLNGLVVVSYGTNTFNRIANGVGVTPVGAPTNSVATVTGNTIFNNNDTGVWVVDESSAGPFPVATVFQNTIFNNGAGVVVGGGPSPNDQSQNDQTVISQNSIFDNTPRPRMTPFAPPTPPVTSGLGIDLGDNGVTLNAPPGKSPGPNNFVNFPVLTSGGIEGANLDLQGFALPGSVIELFIAAPDPTGFGEGKTYLVTLTEGSAADLDNTVGTYGPGPINGLLQGTNTTNRFRFLIPLASLPGVAAGTVLTSTATLGDPVTSEFSGNVTVTQAEADLVVGKRVSNPTPNVGDTITYTVRVTNDGPDTATGVTLQDILPAQVSFQSSNATQGTYDPATGTWTVGTVAVGVTQTLTVTALVVLPHPQANTASISHADQSDPNPENNSDTASINPQQADLELTKTVNDPMPNVGETVTFLVTLTNNGPGIATGVQVTDLLPAGLTFVSATPSQGSYASATGLWTVGTVAAAAAPTLQIVATVVSPGNKTNVARVSAADQFDPDPGNNSAGATVTAQQPGAPPQADLVVGKEVDNRRPNVGDTVTFFAIVTNLGPSTATGVTVSDPLPAGLILLAAIPSQGSYDSGTGVWTVGAVTPGVTQFLQLQARVVSAVAQTNTATISHSDQFDPNPGNNTASATVTPRIHIVLPTAIGKVNLLGSQLLAGAQGDLMAQTAFVNVLYADVLGRTADVAGVNYWVGLLQEGFTRAQVAAGIWESPEHRGVQVDTLYRALLRRPADPLGVAYWGGLLLGGQSEEQVAAGILASAEYALTHPDAASFVNGLYAAVLGRALDSAGAAYWEGLLQSGASRAAVAAGVLASPEAMGLGLARDYAAFLGRPLDPAGWQFWVPLALTTPAPTETAAVGVLASDAYFQTAGQLASA